VAPRIEDVEYGDYVQISQTLNLTGVDYITVKVAIAQPASMPDARDVSKDVQFIASSVGSPGNKIVIPARLKDADVGSIVTISGATNGANNGDLRIVGLQDSITAYVNKVLVTEGPRAAITATQKGARWKFSMLVFDGTSIVERARCIQEKTESKFFRTDLKMNVSKLTGSKNIYFRMTLIEHIPAKTYAMA